ncbi:iron complex transport system permease protein [Roseibium suaedae]|uniref:Iron complex transport system permease protein n=1 Tax=Roseibium suaedae TaxID=735517 RepID=A0A1M7BDK8_9HYPH|nr:iron complex transport system permease protein [Roseibium suaedae]
MPEMSRISDVRKVPGGAWLVLLALFALAATVTNLGPALADLGGSVIFGVDDMTNQPAVQFHFSRLPRLAMAFLAGGALGVAGALLQQILRNPLASPSTVGIEAGAQLALAVTMVFFPVLLGWSRDLVTLGGGSLAMLGVFLVAWQAGFSPLSVMLAGLMAGLYASACVTLLALMKEHYLGGLFIWGGGSLVQQDWRPVISLLPRVAGGLVLALLLLRPLTLLSLDEGAKGLGLKIAQIRAAGLAIAAALTGFVVSAVGIIGFVGLAAPAFARMTGARTPASRLLLSGISGALLLTTTDQLLQILESGTGIFLPTGAVTAMLGAPLLLVLVRRLPARAHRASSAEKIAPERSRAPVWMVAGLAGACLLAVAAAVLIGRGIDGSFLLSPFDQLEDLLPWRLPRTLVAGSAGILLGLAGVFIQRLTANPAASPEVLGISSGAVFGVLAVQFLAAGSGYLVQVAGASAGALAVFGILLAMEQRRSRSSDSLLYSGVALGAFLTALVSAVIASGDPRAMLLLQWMTGSTSQADWTSAALLAAIACAALLAAPLFSRVLTLLKLGDEAAQSAGIGLRAARLLVLVFAAVLTAVATLAIGPLSFVGLMAPHLARRAGLLRSLPQMAGAAAFGGLLMILADYLGRVAYFPWQLPAGTMATFIGGPLLVALVLLRRARTA